MGDRVGSVLALLVAPRPPIAVGGKNRNDDLGS